MYNNIGLPTPRGSGTSGYIQKNLAYVPSRRKDMLAQIRACPYIEAPPTLLKTGGNTELLEHKRRRQIEIDLMELEDKLKEKGFSHEEIREAIAEERVHRVERSSDTDAKKNVFDREGFDISKLDTHQIADLKRKQEARLREALCLTPCDLSEKQTEARTRKQLSIAQKKATPYKDSPDGA